jgi:hypothetical protein
MYHRRFQGLPADVIHKEATRSKAQLSRVSHLNVECDKLVRIAG